MLSIAFRRSRRATNHASDPIVRPIARPVRSGMRRPIALIPPRARSRSRFLNALSFGPATLELPDERVPVAALAKQPLDELAERALSAARLQFPCRRGEHF